MNADYFSIEHMHIKFMEEFQKLVAKNKSTPFVSHHVTTKNGEFPIWVAVELFPFGMLSRFYDEMLENDKKKIAREEYRLTQKHLESWLQCLSMLRNRCAHYMRLYYYQFNKWPKSLKSEPCFENTLFDYILVMKKCYPNAAKWNSAIFTRLSALLERV